MRDTKSSRAEVRAATVLPAVDVATPPRASPPRGGHWPPLVILLSKGCALYVGRDTWLERLKRLRRPRRRPQGLACPDVRRRGAFVRWPPGADSTKKIAGARASRPRSLPAGRS